MKPLTRLLLPALAVAPAALAAQIVLTEATLPQPGEAFTYAVDTAYDTDGLFEPGGAQSWVFADFDADAESCISYRAAADGTAGDSITAASLVLTLASSCTPGPATPEVYLRREGGDLLAVGLGTGQPLFPFVRVGTPLLYQRAPLAFGTDTTAVTAEVVTLSGAVLAELPGAEALAGVVDSVRVSLELTTSIRADGWGVAGLPGGELREVLRVRRAAVIDERIEVLVPFLGWIDPTTIQGVPTDLIPTTAPDVIAYEWWAADRAAPLYRATVDSLGVVTTFEVATDLVSGLAEAAAAPDVDVRVTDGSIAVSLAEAAGPWRASVVALDGRVLADASADASRELVIDAGAWPAGLYIVRVDVPGRSPAARRVLLTR